MYEIFSPLKAELVEEDREHLEVVILLITNDIYHLIDRVILETELCSADILSHIDRCAIGTEKQFLVKTFLGEVSPYGVVGTTIEESLCEAFLYLFLTFEISI